MVYVDISTELEPQPKVQQVEQVETFPAPGTMSDE